jgi:Mg2+/Co2+ transporter CorB
VQHSIAKVKQGGYLIVDNTEVEHYLSRFQDEIARNFKTILDQYGPIPYLTHPTTTTVLQKINSGTKKTLKI